jgi:hypothetical protein
MGYENVNGNLISLYKRRREKNQELSPCRYSLEEEEKGRKKYNSLPPSHQNFTFSFTTSLH